MGPGSPLRSVRGSGPYAAAATSAPDDRPLRRFPPGARLPRTAKARKDQDMPDSAPTNRISGRNAFIELLRSEGVTELFGHPGTTALPVMPALPAYPDMGYTLGLQESVVIAMPDGYVPASGQMAARTLPAAPGHGPAKGAPQ